MTGNEAVVIVVEALESCEVPYMLVGSYSSNIYGSDRSTQDADFVIQLANDILEPFHVRLNASDIHPVMNILVGEQGQDTVRSWHFDATYLTIAMPVVMPEPTGQLDGKFRIWPNVREFSQSKLRDRIYSNLARVELLRKAVNHFSVNFVPGNLYFFYGFRSYHGTEELDVKKLRANCLINFGGPLFDLNNGKVMSYKR